MSQFGGTEYTGYAGAELAIIEWFWVLVMGYVLFCVLLCRSDISS